MTRTESLDESHEVHVIYMDFTRAFDTVPHKMPKKKLEMYGTKGNTLDEGLLG